MAAPNIINTVTITGKTAVLNVTTTPTDIVSGVTDHVLKVNSLIVANVDGVNAATVNVSLYRSATEYFIAYTVNVVADSSMVIIGKDNPIYVEEADTIRVTASATGDLTAVASYEDLID